MIFLRPHLVEAKCAPNGRRFPGALCDAMKRVLLETFAATAPAIGVPPGNAGRTGAVAC